MGEEEERNEGSNDEVDGVRSVSFTNSSVCGCVVEKLSVIGVLAITGEAIDIGVSVHVCDGGNSSELESIEYEFVSVGKRDVVEGDDVLLQ